MNIVIILLIYTFVGILSYALSVRRINEEDKGFLLTIVSLWPISFITIMIIAIVTLTQNKIKRIKSKLDKTIPLSVFCKEPSEI